MQIRIKILAFLYILAFIGLVARLFFWQVIKGSELAQQAKKKHKTGRQLTAPRGNLLASAGYELSLIDEGYL